MRMLHNNLLVKKLTKEQLGKVVLPDSVADQWFRGRVLKVGGRVEEDINEGDIVVFLPAPPHMGGEYPAIDAEGNILIPESYVAAIED